MAFEDKQKYVMNEMIEQEYIKLFISEVVGPKPFCFKRLKEHAATKKMGEIDLSKTEKIVMVGNSL